jgi:hypothetical protein
LEGTLLKNKETQAPSPNKLGDDLLQIKESQAPSPNTFGDNLLHEQKKEAPSQNTFGDYLLQKQRIASTVPKQIWKELLTNTKNRQAPSPNKLA